MRLLSNAENLNNGDESAIRDLLVLGGLEPMEEVQDSNPQGGVKETLSIPG
jgi:hypothetical protein